MYNSFCFHRDSRIRKKNNSLSDIYNQTHNFVNLSFVYIVCSIVILREAYPSNFVVTLKVVVFCNKHAKNAADLLLLPAKASDSADLNHWIDEISHFLFFLL